MARGKRSRAREEAPEEEAAAPEVSEEAGKSKEDDTGKDEEPVKAEKEGNDRGEGPDNRETLEHENEDEASREPFLSRCKAVLQLLMDHRYAWLFNEPVDPVALQIPDYPSVIKNPMDLGTVQGKLDKNAYTDLPIDFIHDVRLTFDNAMLYNPPGHDVHNSAKKMMAFFEKEWHKSASKSMPGKGTPASSTTRTPKHVVSAKAFSFEEKQILLENLQALPSHMQHGAVLLMMERSPHVDWSGDEVDVQLDLLDNQLLQELEEHVKKCMKGAASSDKKTKQAFGSSKVRGKGKQRKGKGKVDEEDEEEIGFSIDVPLSLFPAQKAK